MEENHQAGPGQGRRSKGGINMGEPGEEKSREDLPIPLKMVTSLKGLTVAPYLCTRGSLGGFKT